jgi:hypothetical protein
MFYNKTTLLIITSIHWSWHISITIHGKATNPKNVKQNSHESSNPSFLFINIKITSYIQNNIIIINDTYLLKKIFIKGLAFLWAICPCICWLVFHNHDELVKIINS